MPARRRDEDRDLPRNVYNRGGTFYYRDRSRKEFSLGRDRTLAIQQGLTAEAADGQSKQRRAQMRMDAMLMTLRIPDVDGRALLTPGAIIERSQPAAVCGVYFLISDGTIVYVGQSRDCLRRIANHKSEKRRFDSYYVLPLPADALSEVEAAYIAKFCPTLNIAKPPDAGRNLAAVTFGDVMCGMK